MASVTQITYLVGDATNPIKKPCVICHICNDIGKWGAGFVVPLGRKYPPAKTEYQRAIQDGKLGLGQVQFVPVLNDVMIANMVAQQGIGPTADGTPPIRYKALGECLGQVASFCKMQVNNGRPCTVHGPRFGAGLAKGDWKIIEALIQNRLCAEGVEVFIYDLK